ncbi:hypothetical protein [Salinibacterium sp. M195]|uniref:hypothetical protein n=1 Tax=Salinibacterium sp. M195 TaxID=2583374 RepID=UPI001C62E01F|nr:hypothetical protein [Salinibacterium sp. M195]QYH34818.1 hypothetical protein FFT87_02000 [Salinibacterium sp. M195]
MRPAIVGIFATFAALGLSGCTSVAEETYSGGPEQPLTTIEKDFIDGDPSVVWLTDPGHFALTLSGSSSCPAYPTEVREIDTQTIEVVLQMTLRPICSADLALVTYELSTPTGIDESSPVVVVVETDEFELAPR